MKRFYTSKRALKVKHLQKLGKPLLRQAHAGLPFALYLMLASHFNCPNTFCKIALPVPTGS